MKKLLLFILLVIFSLLGATYFTGSRIEKEYRKNIIEVADHYGLQYDIQRYDRGWFSADVVVKLSKRPDSKLDVPSFSILLNDTVSHGPLPFAYWINTGGASPTGGLIERQLTIEFGGRAASTPKQVVNGLVNIDFTGDSIARYQSDELVMREFFTASDLVLEVHDKNGLTEIDLKAKSILSPTWAGISLLGVHHQVKTEWNEKGQLSADATLNATSVRFDDLGYQVERNNTAPILLSTKFTPQRRIASFVMHVPKMSFKSGADLYDLGETLVEYRHNTAIGAANFSLLTDEIASRRGDEAQARGVSLRGTVTGIKSNAVVADMQLAVGSAWRKKKGQQVVGLQGLKLANQWLVDRKAGTQLYRILKGSRLDGDDYETILEGARKAKLALDLDSLKYHRKTRTIDLQGQRLAWEYRRGTGPAGEQRNTVLSMATRSLQAAETRLGLKVLVSNLRAEQTATIENSYFEKIRDQLKANGSQTPITKLGSLYDVQHAFSIATQRKLFDIRADKLAFANWHVDYSGERINCTVDFGFVPTLGEGTGYCRASRIMRDTQVPDHRDYQVNDLVVEAKGLSEGERFKLQLLGNASSLKVDQQNYGNVQSNASINRLNLRDYQHFSQLLNESPLQAKDVAMYESLIISTRPGMTLDVIARGQKGLENARLNVAAQVDGKRALPEAAAMARDEKWLELLHFTRGKGDLIATKSYLNSWIKLLSSPNVISVDLLLQEKWLEAKENGRDVTSRIELKHENEQMQLLVNGTNRLQATPVAPAAP